MAVTEQTLTQLPIDLRTILLRSLTPRWNKYMVGEPTARQLAFLLCNDTEEVFYGGAAGGGKSQALLLAAAQYVDVPDYHALLLRRTYADLSKPGALIPRSLDWWANTDAKWSAQDKRWTFPSGATISFGYLEHALDIYHFQGAEYQFIGFDELTQFQEEQYRYLFSRKRRTLKGAIRNVPTRVRAASNPGGVGHEWVRQRFIEEGRSNGRIFIPAKLQDNPYLDRDDYEKSLSQLDPITRAQLLNGDWDILPQGELFHKDWFKIIEEADLPRAFDRRCRYWDFAATVNLSSAYTASMLLGVHQGSYYGIDYGHFKGTPEVVEQHVQGVASRDSRWIDIWIEEEGGSGGKNTISHYQRNVLQGYAVYGHHPDVSKVARAGPVSSAAQAGHFYLVRHDNLNALLDEIGAFPNGPFKDQVDAMTGAFTVLNNKPVPRIRRVGG